jgi:uncharacterized protein (DUF3820 family)
MPEQKPEDVQMPFGKHRGKTLGDILAEEPSYLAWLSDADIQSAVLREGVRKMCERYEHEVFGDDD